MSRRKGSGKLTSFPPSINGAKEFSKRKQRMEILPRENLGKSSRKVVDVDGTIISSSSSSFSYNQAATYDIVDTVSHKRPYREGGPFLKRSFQVFHRPTGASYSSVSDGPFGWKIHDTYSGKSKIGELSGVPPNLITNEYMVNGMNLMPVLPDLAGYGPEIISRLSPLNERVNLGQAITELLHDGLPKIPRIRQLKSKLDFFKQLGDQFTNANFGWRLFLQDYRDLYDSIVNLDKRIEQLLKDNGKPVRRTGKVLDEVDRQTYVQSIGVDAGYPAFNTFGPTYSGIAPSPDMRRTERISTKIWFVGTFRYHLPEGLTPLIGQSADRLRARDTLLGIRPTPALLYNVIPWTWLIDWVSNVGDVLANWSRHVDDNEVLQNAFLMRHYRKEVTFEAWSSEYYFPSSGKPIVPSFDHTSSLVWDQKERIAASPFGFSVRFDGLSPYQIAVLAALGISKVNL